MHFLLSWVSVAGHGLPPGAASRGSSPLPLEGFWLRRLLLLQSAALCSQAPECRLGSEAHKLSGSAAGGICLDQASEPWALAWQVDS